MGLPEGGFKVGPRPHEDALERRRAKESAEVEEHKAKIEAGLGYASTIAEVLGEVTQEAEEEAPVAHPKSHKAVQEIDNYLASIDEVLASSAA